MTSSPRRRSHSANPPMSSSAILSLMLRTSRKDRLPGEPPTPACTTDGRVPLAQVAPALEQWPPCLGRTHPSSLRVPHERKRFSSRDDKYHKRNQFSHARCPFSGHATILAPRPILAGGDDHGAPIIRVLALPNSERGLAHGASLAMDSTRLTASAALA